MSLVTSSVVGSVAAAATSVELHGIPLFLDTVKAVFTEAPLSFFVRAGLFAGVTVATAYFIIHRVKKMKKMQEQAEEEEERRGSPLLFEREDISPAERALGVDDFVHDEDRIEELDEIMKELKESGSILYGNHRPRDSRPARQDGKKPGKKKGKKGKKKKSIGRKYTYGRNLSEDARKAGRAELKRWYSLFGTDNFDLERVDKAARELGLDDSGNQDDNDGEDAA